jgi:hypothetical protein
MDLRDFLSEHNIEFREVGTHHHTREGWINIDCPRCGSSSGKFHLGINLEGFYANCWRCGSVSVFEIIKELTGVSFTDTKDLQKTRTKPLERKYGRLKVPPGLTDLTPRATRYLESRGFSPRKIIPLWRIKSTPNIGRLSYRIWIPIIFQGEVVSWTTRATVEGEGIVRYISAQPGEEKLPHRELLYGEDFVRHAIVVVEGPLDVWKFGPGGVATFGTGYSSTQLLRMSRYPVRTICFDMDSPGRKKADKLVKELQKFPGVTNLVELETGKDLGSCDKAEIREIRRKFL